MPYPIKCKLHRVFVENIRQRREDLGLTQREVAQRMRIAQPSYAAIESGRFTPGLEVVEQVAKALGVNPLQLLFPQEFATISEK